MYSALRIVIGSGRRTPRLSENPTGVKIDYLRSINTVNKHQWGMYNNAKDTQALYARHPVHQHPKCNEEIPISLPLYKHAQCKTFFSSSHIQSVPLANGCNREIRNYPQGGVLY